MRPLPFHGRPDIGELRQYAFDARLHADQVNAKAGLDRPAPFTQWQQIELGGKICSEVAIDNTARCCVEECGQEAGISFDRSSGSQNGELRRDI